MPASGRACVVHSGDRVDGYCTTTVPVIPNAQEGRKPKADPMAKRTPGIPGPSACHEPFGT